jgi:prepilin-type N-terminal cleavage/methylation domain-containing protein
VDRQTGGFTIIEVLVALALFAVIVLVVVAPLTGLFGLTRQSVRQTDATGAAQATLEDVRGQWQNWQKYDVGCVYGTTAAFPVSGGVSVTVSTQGMTAQGANIGSASTLTRSSSCAGSTGPRTALPPATSPSLRRITVTATAGGRTSTLATEVARP